MHHVPPPPLMDSGGDGGREEPQTPRRGRASWDAGVTEPDTDSIGAETKPEALVPARPPESGPGVSGSAGEGSGFDGGGRLQTGTTIRIRGRPQSAGPAQTRRAAAAKASPPAGGAASSSSSLRARRQRPQSTTSARSTRKKT